MHAHNGKDKIEFLWSPLGVFSTNIGPEYIISCVRPGVGFDAVKYENLCRKMAWHGANATRELPGWWTTSGDLVDINIWDTKYYLMIREAAKIANRNGLRFYFSVFDECHRKSGLPSPWSAFSDQFYGDDARDAVMHYLGNVVEALHGLDVGFQAINEPRNNAGKLCAEIIIKLISLGVESQKIIHGVDERLKKIPGTGYDMTYIAMREELGKHGISSQQLKSEFQSPIHELTAQRFIEFWGDNDEMNGKRFLSLSLDGSKNEFGERPNNTEIATILGDIYARKNPEKWNFEAVSKRTYDNWEVGDIVNHFHKYKFHFDLDNYGKNPNFSWPYEEKKEEKPEEIGPGVVIPPVEPPKPKKMKWWQKILKFFGLR